MNRLSVRKVASGCAAVSCVGLAFVAFGSFQKLINPHAVPDKGMAVAPLDDSNDREVVLSEIQAGALRATRTKADVEKSKQNILMNDPTMQLNWGVAKTDSARAWEISQGDKETKVAIIDTGIDVHHPDLKENLCVNSGEAGLDSKGHDKSNNGIDDDANGFIDDVHGWNFVHNNNDLTDNHGHGTHIAGIIAANGASRGGVNGVAPKACVMVLKYYDPRAPGVNNLRNTIQAIHYATKMGARIINYSGGGVEYSQEEHDAVKAASDKGILFVAAAGNERSNSDEKDKHYYPADYGLPNIISVTAVNPSVTVLASSNYGVRTVDIAAPGENIYSTLPGGSHGTMTGTSQATAFVTGVAELIASNNAEFTDIDIKKYILKTGDEYATLLSKTGTAKLLNSYKALSTLDKGVGASGVMATNTSHMGARAFASDQNLKDPQLNTSALNNAADKGQEPTEAIAMFGREFMRKLGGPTPTDVRPRQN